MARGAGARAMVLAALVVAAAAAPAPAAELSAAMGKALFERAWIPAPASTDATDGLGPLFSGRACAACHPGGGPARLRAAGGSWADGGSSSASAMPPAGPIPVTGPSCRRRRFPGSPRKAG